MLSVLQHNNIHSLYLRITFWINKIAKLFNRPKRETQDYEALEFELQGVHKLHLKSVMVFLRYMQDLVDRLINLKVKTTEDFEWQFKLKTNWNDDDQAEVICGGWKMQMGYEYLATTERLMLMPVTERYFVFIASTLREKNAVMFNCIPDNHNAAQIVSEFASFAQVPFYSLACHNELSLSSIAQLLNGCAMASVWLFMEHMD